MITHLVLMKLTEDAKHEAIAEEVLALEGKIPGLLGIAGGKSAVQLRSTWDLGFVMKIADVASVHAYQTHPAHLALGDSIRPFIAELATCDLTGIDAE